MREPFTAYHWKNDGEQVGCQRIHTALPVSPIFSRARRFGPDNGRLAPPCSEKADVIVMNVIASRTNEMYTQQSTHLNYSYLLFVYGISLVNYVSVLRTSPFQYELHSVLLMSTLNVLFLYIAILFLMIIPAYVTVISVIKDKHIYLA